MNIVNEIIENSNPVEERQAIDRLSFKKDYLDTGKPLVIRGYARPWPAHKKWSLEYFATLDSDSSVNVLKGEYIQGNQKFQSGEFRSFIQALQNEDPGPKTSYLAALNIFNYFPELQHDTDFSLYSSFTSYDLKLAWIGPKGTISGFHADGVNNMYAQIEGKKRFIIASRDYDKRMYPSKKYIAGAIGSKVDINHFDPHKFPRFKEVEFLHVVLEPGDVLFLPKKWWHYVESLDTSISINNFGYSNLEKYTVALPEHIKDYFHRKGWYKPNNCLCHKIVNGKRVLHD